jgi:formate hydrogenlyase transcriptional activator
MDVLIPKRTDTECSEAVLRISEAVSASGKAEKLIGVLAEHLGEFLTFDHLDLLVFRESRNQVECYAWSKGGLPLPWDKVSEPLSNFENLPIAQLYNSQEPLLVEDWNNDERFPGVKQLLAKSGITIRSAVRVPLTTPHRRFGALGIASEAPNAYSRDDISFLLMIARVVAFAIEDGLNLRRADATQAELERKNDRLQLLLKLTNSITSKLELKEVLRTVAANVREVMHCDAANISLPGVEPGTFRLYVVDFPTSKGLVQEEQIITPGERSPAKRAFETLKPVISTPEDGPPGSYANKSAAEGLKTVCFIPLVNRGRALGNLNLARATKDPFTAEDIEFLSQAGGQIAIAIENALAYSEISELKDKLAQEKLYLEEEIRSEMNFEQIIGNSAALKHVLQLVETVAPSDSTVLLLGETGTGKELIARAIHDRSRRKDRTFVKLNCAAIPTGLLESELFGHEKGAFTGAISQKIGRMELADKGTLFLDEVGDIPIDIQPKLLRALQEREFERLGSTRTQKVSVRLIAATNRDLEKMAANREFRSDLYYRLNVFPIRIPPLRDRKEDIPLLVSYFVQKFAKQMQKKIETIPAVVMKGLTAWEWPGNIRELENFIERAVILTRGKALEAPPGELRRSQHEEPTRAATQPVQDDIARIVKETISALNEKKDIADEYEKKQREEILRALTESKGRVGGSDGAAALLGINRTTLLSRMKKLGINPKQYA